ncbi:hypothetical protein R3P38DRAFT_1360511 [Favolaschia claudopus]|uniref:Uncharacterized protein n=1 Tax=Favolaschia claudopus TaxID=2862362 RepID=A0AAW0DWA1_9AGAR
MLLLSWNPGSDPRLMLTSAKSAPRLAAPKNSNLEDRRENCIRAQRIDRRLTGYTRRQGCNYFRRRMHCIEQYKNNMQVTWKPAEHSVVREPHIRIFLLKIISGFSSPTDGGAHTRGRCTIFFDEGIKNHHRFSSRSDLSEAQNTGEFELSIFIKRPRSGFLTTCGVPILRDSALLKGSDFGPETGLLSHSGPRAVRVLFRVRFLWFNHNWIPGRSLTPGSTR